MADKRYILEDLLHFYFSETIAAFPDAARSNLYGSTFSIRFSNAIKYLGRSFRESFSKLPASSIQSIKNKNWLYLIGDNNYNSLKFLENQIGETVYVSPYRYQRKGSTVYRLSHSSRFRYLLAEIPAFLNLFFSGRKEVDRAWDAVFRAGGLYEYSLALLKAYEPKSIVFSNDTTLEPRALLLAAKALGIPTFYIQHACVREDFPPLKFTCSFLEGEDAYQKYKQSGPVEGEVKLVGVPKIDAYLSRKNTNKKVQSIGICSNLLDPIESVETVVNTLLETFPNCSITYRPHPGDSRQVSFDVSQLKISNSREENPYEFLLTQDLVIAGNTSIHYEAAMLNVASVYYKFDKSGLDDTYGFVKNKLVEQALSIDTLEGIIKEYIIEKSDISERARYYNAVLGTANEGKSQEMVREYIHQHLANNTLEKKEA